MLKKNVTIQYISEKYGLSAAMTSRVINKETKFWISFLHWNIQVVSSNIYSGYARILTVFAVSRAFCSVVMKIKIKYFENGVKNER